MAVNNIFIQLCKQSGLPEPTPEYMFAKDIGRRWRVDYFFQKESVCVALEVEGGAWVNGRHNRASGFVKDIEKYNELSRRGIYLLRVLPGELLSMNTINLITDTINNGKLN